MLFKTKHNQIIFYQLLSSWYKTFCMGWPGMYPLENLYTTHPMRAPNVDEKMIFYDDQLLVLKSFTEKPCQILILCRGIGIEAQTL